MPLRMCDPRFLASLFCSSISFTLARNTSCFRNATSQGHCESSSSPQYSDLLSYLNAYFTNSGSNVASSMSLRENFFTPAAFCIFFGMITLALTASRSFSGNCLDKMFSVFLVVSIEPPPTSRTALSMVSFSFASSMIACFNSSSVGPDWSFSSSTSSTTLPKIPFLEEEEEDPLLLSFIFSSELPPKLAIAYDPAVNFFISFVATTLFFSLESSKSSSISSSSAFFLSLQKGSCFFKVVTSSLFLIPFSLINLSYSLFVKSAN